MAATNPVTSHPPGAFCWIELATSDQNGGKEFYGKLFGWTFEDMPMGPGETYTMFKLRGKDVAAGYRLDPKKQPGVPPHWMLYVTTADADATAAKSAELGGETVAAPFDVFDAGRMAVLKDPVGAAFCVWQPKSNPGIGIQNEPGSFCWGQLNTNDTANSEAYYVALFGWDAKTGTGGGMTYTEFRRGGVPFGGMMALPPGLKARAHWLAYFAVADVDAAATAAALRDATRVRPADLPASARSSSVEEGWTHPRVAGGDLVEEIATLKAEPGNEILAHGGASFARSLVRHGLVDEYRLVVHPVVLGKGLSLFSDLPRAADLRLEEVTAFPGGASAHVYRPAS